MTGQRSFAASLMRGGTSKGLVVLADELPIDTRERDTLLLAAMGSPDVRQIDGLGGGHPLTSKVAVVSQSDRDDADVDYLFLQVWPDRAEVSDGQNCGNMLAAVGPFALDAGLVSPAADGATAVRVWMRNTESLAVVRVPTEDGHPRYDGDAHVDGVPGAHAPIEIDFLDIAGSSCGALLPTGHVVDEFDGTRATCVDNGMPVVCVSAADLGVTGHESPAQLESDDRLGERVDRVRRAAGEAMGLGDVRAKSTPKVSLLAPSRQGGAVSTRTFIPRRVHEAIGVFGAVSVATACVIPGSVAAGIATVSPGAGRHVIDVEHPGGAFTVTMDVELDDHESAGIRVHRAALVRTARLLMRGDVFVPAAVTPVETTT